MLTQFVGSSRSRSHGRQHDRNAGGVRVSFRGTAHWRRTSL